MSKRKNNYYIEKVARDTGRSYDDVKAEMELDRVKFGISFRDYYIGGIHNVLPHEKKKAARTVVNDRMKKRERICSIKEKTGLSPKAIFRSINELNKKEIFKVSLASYEKYKMFEKSDEENIETLRALSDRDSLVKELRKKVRLLDKGQMSYSEFEEEMEPIYTLTKQLLSAEYKKQLIDRVRRIIPEEMKNEETMEWIAEDMEVTRLVLRFGHTEYIMFRFFEKDLEERRTFLSAAERRKVLNKKNDSEASAILNNKFKCYEAMKEYYGREATLINSKESFADFKKFTKRHTVFVVKPTELSFGKGIIKVKSTPLKIKTQFEELLNNYGEFMVEELITQHKCMSLFNPDSVNTVRIPTYFNGEKTIVQRPFMKIGRAGSFVDNGGSGGILVAIDYETGKLIGNGIDEEGITYECHPDSKIVFDQYQLPNWNEVKKLADKVSNKIDNASYIGWDFACTDKGHWIVVEGNAMTQFIGQQATLNKGMRKEFLKDVKK